MAVKDIQAILINIKNFIILKALSFLQNNHFRTLINKILSSTVQDGIFGVIFGLAPMTFRYLVEQAPVMFCQYAFFLHHCLVLVIMIKSIAMILVRYICVFHSKNITAIQDDFWVHFLNIWIRGFSALAYFIASQITNKRPMEYYFCLGKIQKKSQADGPYVDYIWISFFILANIVLLIIGVQSKIRECQMKNIEMAVIKQGYYFTETRKMNLITFSIVFIGSIILFLTVLIPAYQMEYGDLHSLSTYPGYLWVYMVHLYSGNIQMIQYIPFFYARNIHLYNFAKRVIKEKFQEFIQK
jgi:hypothetical protein